MKTMFQEDLGGQQFSLLVVYEHLSLKTLSYALDPKEFPLVFLF